MCSLVLLMLAADWLRDGEPPQSKRDAFGSMRYGIFVHNVYMLTAPPAGATYETPDEFADLFDAQAFAGQMADIGVEYVIFTAWHRGYYILGPNTAMDKWLPGHATKRDLIGELADALAMKGIALVLYTGPCGGLPFGGLNLSPEERAKVGFDEYDKAKSKPMPVFNDFLNEVYAELAERCSEKPNVLGFFLDGWAAPGGRLDVKRLCNTLRTHFPQAILISQQALPGVIDPYYAKDYNTPKTDDLDLIPALSIGHSATFAGPWWRSKSDHAGKPRFSAETIFRFTVFNAGAGGAGGFGWAVSPLADGKTWGADNSEPLPTFRVVNKYIQPIREAVCGVTRSRSWTLPDGITFSKGPAYVATRSLDGTKEYVHVLKPGETKSVVLTKPVEDFTSARLLVSGHPVAMEKGADSLRLTLGDGDQWDPLDTVIVLEVAHGQLPKAGITPNKEGGGVSRFESLSPDEKLIAAVHDQELLASRAALADLSKAGENPYLAGFPAPRPYSTHPNYATKLETRTDGLSYKPKSLYDEQLKGLQGFLDNNFIPAVKKYCEGGHIKADFDSLKFSIAKRPSTSGLNVYEDVPYNILGKRALVLDLYTPQAAPKSKGYPVLMFFHGGGWLGGHHYSNRAVAISMAKQGFATVVVEYRLGVEAIFPAAVWDGKAAVRWVRKHADRYHMDPNMILVSGGSAGGNIAGLVGMTNGDLRFEGDGNHKEFSSDVHGVIAYDGAVHQSNGLWTGGGEGRPDPTKADPWFYNESIPLFHIIMKDGGVPILFVKGGRPLHLWIKKHIGAIQVDWLDHRWVHGFEVFDPSKDILVEQLTEYFKSDTSLWDGKLAL